MDGWKNIIRIALTCDVERDSSIKNDLPKVIDIFNEFKAVGTWFIQHDFGKYYTEHFGRVDEKFPEILEKLSHIGEIGSHVHFRNKKGEFCSDFNFQKQLLEKATDSLRSKGYNVKSFRGGDHFFNNDTLKVLEELNYEIDSSVMQGFSRKIHGNFLINHKIRKSGLKINEPYFLSKDNYLEPGESNILEIPVTNLAFFLKKPTFFIPFPIPGNIKIGKISNLSFLFSKFLGFLKNDILIVFLFHDFNLCGKNSIYNFRKFIEKCTNDKNTKFVTLKEVKSKHA